jgi:hypothetical protein
MNTTTRQYIRARLRDAQVALERDYSARREAWPWYDESTPMHESPAFRIGYARGAVEAALAALDEPERAPVTKWVPLDDEEEPRWEDVWEDVNWEQVEIGRAVVGLHIEVQPWPRT